MVTGSFRSFGALDNVYFFVAFKAPQPLVANYDFSIGASGN